MSRFNVAEGKPEELIQEAPSGKEVGLGKAPRSKKMRAPSESLVEQTAGALGFVIDALAAGVTPENAKTAALKKFRTGVRVNDARIAGAVDTLLATRRCARSRR
jgi:hypothetical protein